MASVIRNEVGAPIKVNGYAVLESRVSRKHRFSSSTQEAYIVLCDRNPSNEHDTRFVSWVVYPDDGVAHGHYGHTRAETHYSER